MTTDPTLTGLLNELREAVSTDTRVRVDWVENKLRLFRVLTEIRARFSANQDFGRCLHDNGFDSLSHDERAAALNLGADLDLARKLLTESNSWSVLEIWRRVRRASKTPDPKPRPVNPANDEKRDRAFAVYDRRKAAGEELTLTAVQAEAGVSNTVIRAVFTAREAEAAATTKAEEAAELTAFVRPLEEEVLRHIASLKGPEKKRWDKEVERYRYFLAQEKADGIEVGIRKWKAEVGLDFYDKRLDKFEAMFTDWPYSALRKTEYNLILRCLHPDTGAHVSPEDRAEALHAVVRNKLRLVSLTAEERQAEMRNLRSDMPKTVQEMLARRQKAKAG